MCNTSPYAQAQRHLYRAAQSATNQAHATRGRAIPYNTHHITSTRAHTHTDCRRFKWHWDNSDRDGIGDARMEPQGHSGGGLHAKQQTHNGCSDHNTASSHFCSMLTCCSRAPPPTHTHSAHTKHPAVPLINPNTRTNDCKKQAMSPQPVRATEKDSSSMPDCRQAAAY
jgi:hypothetical protein